MSSTGPRRPGARDSDARSPRATPQRRARATRLAILTAAAEHFARNGYHATSLDSVLADSGGTKGALYFHFVSKDALARAVIAEMARGWGELRKQVNGRGLDPLSALLTLVDEVVVLLVGNPIAQGGIRLLNDLPPCGQHTPWHYGVAEGDALALLTQAARAGLLQEGIEPALLARQVVAVVAGHRQICDAMDDRHDLRQRLDEAWDLLLPAIATDAWLAAWCATRSR
ncbi:MAG: ScbR family autoregulator-binding transcription factor [Pseudonocardiaceae bacterium]